MQGKVWDEIESSVWDEIEHTPLQLGMSRRLGKKIVHIFPPKRHIFQDGGSNRFHSLRSATLHVQP
jgi:hypothetical protein